LKFLVDNQLPAALAHWVRGEGYHAEHVIEIEMAQVSDELIWDYAIKNEMVILTKDEDFVNLVLLRLETTPVVWIRIGNCRKAALLEKIQEAWEKLISKLEEGDQLIEVY